MLAVVTKINYRDIEKVIASLFLVYSSCPYLKELFITVWKVDLFDDLVAKFFFGANIPICEIRNCRSKEKIIWSDLLLNKSASKLALTS